MQSPLLHPSVCVSICILSIFLTLIVYNKTRDRRILIKGSIVLLNIWSAGMPMYAHPQNCPFSLAGSRPPSNTWILGPIGAHKPNSISIGSAVFAGETNITDRPRCKKCDNRPHLHCESKKRGRTFVILTLEKHVRFL